MSLYIGNLSARTRRDELERVFRRFGRCNLQLKDGFGFVVYDFSLNAEKALRALEGRNICGEPLNLSWSNKQPKPFQKYGRGARGYELRGRNSASRKTSLNDWRDYRSDIKPPDGNGARLNSEELLDEGRDFHHENIEDYNGQELYNFREDLPADGGGGVPKMVDNGRWGEQVDDLANDNGDTNGMMFDRYEPYQGYDRNDKDEIRLMANSDGTARRSLHENVRRDHDNDTILNRHNVSKSQQTCYSCGDRGHKMRNCPRQHPPRKRFTRFNHRQDDDIKTRSRHEGRLERFGSKPWERMQSGRDTALRHRNDSRTSDSGKVQMLVNRNSPLIKQTDRPQRKEHGGKKRSRRETGSPKRYSAKRARRSVSSPLHSGYPVSRSHSTSKSVPRSISRSRLRSISSGADSLSSKSKSSSKSHCSKSRRPKSRSRSSPTTSLSLSVSLGHLPSSTGRAQLNHKGLGKATGASTEFKDIEDEQRELIESDGFFEKADIENTTVAMNGENAVSQFNMEEVTRENQPLCRGDDVTSRSSFEVTNPGTPLPETSTLAAGSLSPEGMKETLDHQNSSALITAHVPKTIEQSDSESNADAGRSTSISMEELCMALKHYGLELPKENEGHLSIEAYFGSARMWPWQIIYYRRIRKGPISIQNYARRVAQNQEFGIADRYIRSSSGWGEVDQHKKHFVG
ncbi:uncharacterized protein LOC107432233 [Ziziphus jujuba]|uniref:Uncharacterized protein LOC107432233 n=1 Tax=Ziziphus jujuba TaxID=326968 RepID=A0A6P6FLP5_ZIZJJ|nr:uncharacterized protein LOC107432233 [Ziziphus jujuba]